MTDNSPALFYFSMKYQVYGQIPLPYLRIIVRSLPLVMGVICNGLFYVRVSKVSLEHTSICPSKHQEIHLITNFKKGCFIGRASR